jgi:predicted Zn finger-like uncharacterized protein
MIQVRCPSCEATFDTDERRIPKSGMRARCPRCGSSIFVLPDGSATMAAPRQTPGPSAEPAAAASAPATSAPNAPAAAALFALDDLPALVEPPLPAGASVGSAPALDDPFASQLLTIGAPEPSTSPALADFGFDPSSPSSTALPALARGGAIAGAGSIGTAVDPLPAPRAPEPSFDNLPILRSPGGPGEASPSDLESELPSPFGEASILRPLDLSAQRSLNSATVRPLELDPGGPSGPAPRTAPAMSPASSRADAAQGAPPRDPVIPAPLEKKPTRSEAVLPGEDGARAPGGMDFGVIDLGVEPAAIPADASEFVAIPSDPTSAPAQAVTSGAAPRELEALPPPAHASALLASIPTATAKPSSKPSSPRRPKIYAAAGVLGAVILVGGGLSFTSLGPFGSHAIEEAINGNARRTAATAAIRAAGVLLARDDFGSLRRAMRQLDAQLASTPKNAELHAYTTLVYYFSLARFGADSQIANRARALYEAMARLPPQTEYVSAARAARDLGQGRPERVRRQRSPEAAARDLEVMAALDGDPAAALESARAANTARRSPRTRYLLARALYLNDERPEALREAESLAADLPSHAGARLIAARIFSSSADRQDRALALAQQVEGFARNASTDERVEAAVLIGDVEFLRGRLGRAREAFERALSLDPRSPAALIGAGKILYQQRDFAESLARFRSAASADANDVEAVIGVTMSAIALRQQAEIRPQIEALTRARPTDARARFWLARTLIALDDRVAAERELREAIRLDDTMLEAYTTLATMLFEAQRPQEAEQELVRARGRVTDVPAIHRAMAEGRLARGDLAGAEVELRQAVQGRPTDLRTRFLLAQVLRRLRNYDGAAAEIDAIAQADAEYPSLLVERGLILQGRGDAAGAVSIFRSAIARESSSWELVVHLASALVASGAFEEAERQITPIVAAHAQHADALFILGRAQLARGNLTDALRSLERATELDGARADFHTYAAEANLQRAQFTRAMAHATQACTLDPTYARAFWIRGEIRVRQHGARDALLDARRALELDPRFADAMVTYAEADSQLAQPEPAMELYRRALALEPDRPEWRTRYARILAEVGRDADALRELDQATRVGDNLAVAPPWLPEAHRLAGEVSARMGRRDVARQHLQRFVDIAPPGTTGVDAARRALAESGG